MNYLVTGGAGFIGSHIVDRLLADGHSVVVLDDFSSGSDANLAQHAEDPKLTIVRASVAEPLNEVFAKAKFDVVFHLAAVPSVQLSIADPVRTHHVNVDGTLNVLDQCRLQGCRFIYASSAAVYGSQEAPHHEQMATQPLSPYALHKVVGEQYASLFHQLFSTPTVALRCFNVYGPRQNPTSEYAGVISKFADRLARKDNITIYGDGEQTRDFVYVADVVQAYVRAAAAEAAVGKAINIGTGKSVTVNQLAETLGQVAGGADIPQHAPAAPAEVRHSRADVSRAKQLLDWQPQVELADGLAKLWQSLHP